MTANQQYIVSRLHPPLSVELPPGSGNSIVSGDGRKRKEGRQMAEEREQKP